MSQEKIILKVYRELSFDSTLSRTLFLATIRVGLKTEKEEFRELAKLIHLSAYSAEDLEQKIEKIKSDFQELAENKSDFLKKVGEVEDVEI